MTLYCFRATPTDRQQTIQVAVMVGWIRFMALVVALSCTMLNGHVEATIQPRQTKISHPQKQQPHSPSYHHQLLQQQYSYSVTRQTTPFQRLRKLLQSSRTTSKRDLLPDVPKCIWNDVRGACNPSQLAYLSINATPVTVLHKAATQAYDRNLVCSGYVNATKCNADTVDRCMYWNQSCVGTDAYELINWIGGDTLDGQATMAAFTCPGTEAATYRVCRTAAQAGPTGICKQLPGCHWVNMTCGDCLPQHWDQKTFKAVQDLRADFESFAVSVWGSCPGACFVRQASLCQKNYNKSAECTEKPYCSWDYDPFDKKKVCSHRDTLSKGTDAFSQAYYKLKVACNNATNEDDCEKARVVPTNIGRYRAATKLKQVTQEQSSKCVL